MTESGVSAVIRSLAVLLLAVAASCSESVVAPPEDPQIPVTIAGTRPATGPFRTDGGEMERGYRLAVVMLNEAGGIGGRPVQLLLRDDGSDPQAAAAIYSELAATDSIDLLVGPYASSITAAVVPVHSFETLLDDLSSVVLNIVRMAEHPESRLAPVTQPTPLQARAFELLEVKPTRLVPIRMTG